MLVEIINGVECRNFDGVDPRGNVPQLMKFYVFIAFVVVLYLVWHVVKAHIGSLVFSSGIHSSVSESLESTVSIVYSGVMASHSAMFNDKHFRNCFGFIEETAAADGTLPSPPLVKRSFLSISMSYLKTSLYLFVLLLAVLGFKIILTTHLGPHSSLVCSILYFLGCFLYTYQVFNFQTNVVMLKLCAVIMVARYDFSYLTGYYFFMRSCSSNTSDIPATSVLSDQSLLVGFLGIRGLLFNLSALAISMSNYKMIETASAYMECSPAFMPVYMSSLFTAYIAYYVIFGISSSESDKVYAVIGSNVVYYDDGRVDSNAGTSSPSARVTQSDIDSAMEISYMKINLQLAILGLVLMMGIVYFLPKDMTTLPASVICSYFISILACFSFSIYKDFNCRTNVLMAVVVLFTISGILGGVYLNSYYFCHFFSLGTAVLLISFHFLRYGGEKQRPVSTAENTSDVAGSPTAFTSVTGTV